MKYKAYFYHMDGNLHFYQPIKQVVNVCQLILQIIYTFAYNKHVTVAEFLLPSN